MTASSQISPLIEAVPNFSEGRRPEVIEAIVSAISRAGGVHLLDVSADADHNRLVVTLAGLPMEVEKALLAGIRTAAERINLDEHQGVHPRFGAADVIPLIPLRGTSLEDCRHWAQQLGRRVATELGLPVYFYGAAALRPGYEDLANIRTPSFQYEQLCEAIQSDPRWMPDLGPAELGPAGACLIGARPPLIAYNLYLNTDQVEVARKVARALRHSSGGLRYVKAAGFLVKGRAQVSLNLSDHHQTPLFRVIEMARREAARYGALIESSELVGLIPEAALLDSAAWYLQWDGYQPNLILEKRLAAAEEAQGALAGEEPPIPEGASQYIELPPDSGLPDVAFAAAVAQASPAPGGGAVLAHVGALSAALAEMVAALTLGKRGYGGVEMQMRAIQAAAADLRGRLDELVGADIAAVQELMRAIRQAKQGGPAADMQASTLQAAEVPLQTGRLAVEVLHLLAQVAEVGNRSAAIDAAAGAHLALAVIEGAALNMSANLAALTEIELTERYEHEMQALLDRARELRMAAVSQARRRAGLDADGPNEDM